MAVALQTIVGAFVDGTVLHSDIIVALLTHHGNISMKSQSKL